MSNKPLRPAKPIKMRRSRENVINLSRRFFGRRTGKTLTDKKKYLFSEYAPLFLPTDNRAVDHIKTYADLHRFDRIELEIGFGNGEFLISNALTNPNTLFIGCELFVNGIASLLTKIEIEKVKNILIFQEDALTLLQESPEDFFSQIFLMFPDPWPKKGHRKRRFLQHDTVDLISGRLRNGGVFNFATDIERYAEWGVIKLNACKTMQICPREITHPFTDTVTRYEKKSFTTDCIRYYISFEKKKSF